MLSLLLTKITHNTKLFPLRKYFDIKFDSWTRYIIADSEISMDFNLYFVYISKCKGFRDIVSDILIFITHDDSCYLNARKGEKTSYCMRFACIILFFNWNFIIYNEVIETDEELCLNAQVERNRNGYIELMLKMNRDES